MTHPIQPLESVNGVTRFKRNAMVEYLLDKGPVDMNDLAMLSFSQEDREQFAQLIGYSLSGFSDLSYVSDETYATAEGMATQGQTEDQARIAYLQETLQTVRTGLKMIVPACFRIHEDDLG